MANPVPPGGKLPPSRGAGLAAFADAVRVGQRTATQASRLISPEAYDAYGNLGGLSVEDPNLPLGSNIEASTQAAIFNANYNPAGGQLIGTRLNSQDQEVPIYAAQNRNYLRASFDLKESGMYIAANNYYYTNFDTTVDQNRGDALEEAADSGTTPQRPADLQEVPTSSTNYKRPRTVAAGYDSKTQILTVVFRDGTFWNYYGISLGTWIIFHDSLSKGPLLNSNRMNKHGDGLLLRECSDHGPADLSQLSPAAQEFFYKVARTSQIYYAQRLRFGAKKWKPGGSVEGYVPKNAGAKQKYKAKQKSARAKLGKNNATANRRKK